MSNQTADLPEDVGVSEQQQAINKQPIDHKIHNNPNNKVNLKIILHLAQL